MPVSSPQSCYENEAQIYGCWKTEAETNQGPEANVGHPS